MKMATASTRGVQAMGLTVGRSDSVTATKEIPVLR
jgi:hypothetical protein